MLRVGAAIDSFDVAHVVEVIFGLLLFPALFEGR